MSDGDWRPIIALGIVALLLFAPPAFQRFGSYQARHAEERIQASQYDTGASRQHGEARCSTVTGQGSFTCSIEIEQASEADAYAKYDLRAQQEMAQWALGVLIATIAGVAVTLAGLVFIVAAYRLNREQLDIQRQAAQDAREAFEEAERPLFFISIRPRPSISEGGQSYIDAEEEARLITEHVEIHNVGTRPAFGVALRLAVGFWETADQEYSLITEGMAEFAVGERKSRFVFFRSEPPKGGIEDRMAAGEIPHITGIFTYDDPLGIRRQRGFRFIAKEQTGILAYVLGYEWERVNDPRFTFDRRIQKDRI